MKLIWESIDTNEIEIIMQQLKEEPGKLLLDPSPENIQRIIHFFKKFEFSEFYSNGQDLQQTILKIIAYNIRQCRILGEKKALDLRDMNFYQSIKHNTLSCITLLSYFIDLKEITQVNCSQSDKATSELILKDKNWVLFANLQNITLTLRSYNHLKGLYNYSSELAPKDNFGTFMFLHTIFPHKDFEKLEFVTVNTLQLSLDSDFRERFLASNHRALQYGIDELRHYLGLGNNSKNISFFWKSFTRTWHATVVGILNTCQRKANESGYNSCTDIIRKIEDIAEEDFYTAWGRSFWNENGALAESLKRIIEFSIKEWESLTSDESQLTLDSIVEFK